MYKYIVPGEMDGRFATECIDTYLNLDNVPKNKKTIDGFIRLKGRLLKKDDTVSEGDLIEFLPSSRMLNALPAPQLIYEDENILIYNKQQGLKCFTEKPGTMTLHTYAEEHMKETDEYSLEAFYFPYVCHHLDENTGGLVIVAKSQIMFEYMLEAFKQRRIRKLYTCVVVGTPEYENANLSTFIESQPSRGRMRIRSKPTRNASPIYTRYWTKKTMPELGLSLLEVQLVTGKMHQIRAHLASVGIPVLGDNIYGDAAANKKFGMPCQAMWAHKLIFDTGTGNALEYLNGKEFIAPTIDLPFIEGLTDAATITNAMGLPSEINIPGITSAELGKVEDVSSDKNDENDENEENSEKTQSSKQETANSEELTQNSRSDEPKSESENDDQTNSKAASDNEISESENADTERAEGLDDEKHSDDQTKSEEESAE